ncbi:uncharacterized protein LOC130088305 [Rhinichthys klamathensis goyatoka]|uniref:uncharacterized protein LOC130088305 n=1 Tax=Rhinichthys klamathensis goyatoka TaxID=3034132 RepID=UPI0024B5BCE8|nr:uncharacterized protein LOC130088305 [Rhinichthys klamathensis goyatoka]
MLTMRAQMDVICCKSVGTDLSMLDIEDFITEICQLKKEVASLEAKLRERGDKPNREDLEKVSVCVTDGTEAQDSVWRSRDTQDSELSLTLLCYTDAQDHGSADQTSDCNAGEQQMKMCSVKLEDCRSLIERRGEETTAEEQQQSHEEEEDDEDDDEERDGDDEFPPAGVSSFLLLFFLTLECLSLDVEQNLCISSSRQSHRGCAVGTGKRND